MDGMLRSGFRAASAGEANPLILEGRSAILRDAAARRRKIAMKSIDASPRQGDRERAS
jgi:hypothetical protein